jgi:glycosyltransferase involved in cell wall biosynthesis
MFTVSVVMATYNGERFVEHQLESVARQTLAPGELIVSDDGSGDRTLEIVHAFAQRAPFPVRVLAGPRRGLAENFWSAAQVATGDVIAWSDQDDVWLPPKLERSVNALQDAGAAFVSHASITMDAEGGLLGDRYPSYRRTRVLRRLEGDPWHVPPGFGSMFRRGLLGEIDFPARPDSHQILRQMNHDHAVSLHAFAAHRRVELAEPLAHYRQHDRNVAGDPTVRGLEAVRTALRIGREQYEALPALARGYGGFTGAQEYFEALARRCERRARAYAPGARPARLARATINGDYGPRDRGRFGASALAKDVVAVLVPGA